MKMPRWLHYVLIVGFTTWMLNSLWETRGRFSVSTLLCVLFVGWNLYVLYNDLRLRFNAWRRRRRLDRLP
jgi:hypothetical protein